MTVGTPVKETYNDKVKLTFAKGESLRDTVDLFKASLEAEVRRAVDFHAADELDENALQALISEAVAFNEASTRP